MPGGVNSPVRAMNSIGRDPISIASGAGAEITDVDGNVYIDWMCQSVRDRCRDPGGRKGHELRGHDRG
jgi:hypothetical protein